MSESRKYFPLKSINEGDFAAIEHLYDTYYDSLCNFAYLFTRDKEVSRDIVSELFVELWQRGKTIKVHTSIKSYLYRSTRNAVISYYRKNKLHRDEDREKMNSLVFDSTPETILLDKELQEKLDHLLAELPLKAGMVFRLKKVDGLTYREIAEIMNISERTVENHIAAAIKKILQILNEKPELWKYFRSAY